MPQRFNFQSSVMLAASLSAIIFAACQSASDVSAQEQTALKPNTVNVRADVWVDNYFELSVNGEKVLIDSTPFKTERSFNGDSKVLDISLPATIALELRDFYENDTGLEYIGSRSQQMGDGGGVAQIIDTATGEALFVTDESMRCTVIHHAPIDKSCQYDRNPQIGVGICDGIITTAPQGWTQPSFDDSHWAAPTIFSANAVRPRRDYDRVSWDSRVKFIWGPDLEQDNVILCRAMIE